MELRHSDMRLCCAVSDIDCLFLTPARRKLDDTELSLCLCRGS